MADSKAPSACTNPWHAGTSLGGAFFPACPSCGGSEQPRSAGPYQLAREIISAANERGVTFREMLHERFPVRGNGGVAHANARLHRETLARIAEWLEPGEYPEPTYGGACG